MKNEQTKNRNVGEETTGERSVRKFVGAGLLEPVAIEKYLKWRKEQPKIVESDGGSDNKDPLPTDTVPTDIVPEVDMDRLAEVVEAEDWLETL